MARSLRHDRPILPLSFGAALAVASLLAVAGLLSMAGIAANPIVASELPFARDSARAEVVTLINAERRAAGHRPLTVDLLLSSRAHDASFACPGGGSTPGRARDNADHAGLTHDLSGCPGRTIVDLMPAWGYRGPTGEILAYNYESSDVVRYRAGCPPGASDFDCGSAGPTLEVSRTAATAVRQWIDSPSHHDVMLGAYDRFGCGAWAGTATTPYGTGGAFYACVFAKGGPPSRLDTRAPAVTGVTVAPAGVATAGAGAFGSTTTSASTAVATVAAGSSIVVSSTVADADALGRVVAWQVAVDGRVVVDALDGGRIDAGRGAVRVRATISTAGLTAGSHAVAIRARDMAGRWSAASTARLVVAP